MPPLKSTTDRGFSPVNSTFLCNEMRYCFDGASAEKSCTIPLSLFLNYRKTSRIWRGCDNPVWENPPRDTEESKVGFAADWRRKAQIKLDIWRITSNQQGHLLSLRSAFICVNLRLKGFSPCLPASVVGFPESSHALRRRLP